MSSYFWIISKISGINPFCFSAKLYMNEYRRIANIFFVRVVECKRQSLPRNNNFLVSISASIGKTPKSDSQMSDLQDFGRFNEFLQTKC